MKDLELLIDKVVSTFRKKPKDIVYVDEWMLLNSVKAVTGNEITATKLREVVDDYLLDELDEEDDKIYVAALYCAKEVVKRCFNKELNESDFEMAYGIDWDMTYFVSVQLAQK